MAKFVTPILYQFDISRNGAVVQSGFFSNEGAQSRVNQLTLRFGAKHSAKPTGKAIINGEDEILDPSSINEDGNIVVDGQAHPAPKDISFKLDGV